jgi:hypothetical protein
MLATTRIAASKPATAAVARVPVVHSIHPKPDQVDAAFLQSCADSEENLRGRPLPID